MGVFIAASGFAIVKMISNLAGKIYRKEESHMHVGNGLGRTLCTSLLKRRLVRHLLVMSFIIFGWATRSAQLPRFLGLQVQRVKFHSLSCFTTHLRGNYKSVKKVLVTLTQV